MPINLVTGAYFDVALDLHLAWDVPFHWRRYYDSRRAGEALPLGRGQTHSYDHRLVFDLDGLSYTTPSGTRHGFVLPTARQRVSTSAAARLERTGQATFRAKAAGEPEVEFEFGHPERPARLIRLFRGTAFQQLHYDNAGAMALLTYGDEPPLHVHQDGAGRILALEWAIGGESRRLWQGEYDARGNLVRVTDARANAELFAFDGANRMTRRTDHNGYRFAMQYDRLGRCVWSSGEGGVQAVRLRFQAGEKRTEVQRADGGLWNFHHSDHRITRIVDPYGGITQREYGPDGSLTAETGPEGETLRTVLDDESGFVGSPYGPPAGVCLPLGDPWFTAANALAYPRQPMGWDGYAAGRHLASITLPPRDAHRFWQTSLPQAALATLKFAGEDGAAIPATPSRMAPRPASPLADQVALPARPAMPMPKKRMAQAVPAGRVERDPLGLLIGHIRPDGARCRWQYDANGNVIRHVDHAGSEWRYDFASWNHLVRETSPLGHATQFTYGPTEQLVRAEDAGGTITAHAFDLKDRLVGRARDNGARDWFRYDLSTGLTELGGPDEAPRVTFLPGAHGRPLIVAPRGGAERQCAYDARGRLTDVAAEDGPKLAIAYDSVGHRVRDLQDGRGTERAYAGLQLAAIIVLERYVTRYATDPDRMRRTITDPSGGRHAVRQLETGVFLFERANGVKELVQYDWDGRCLAKARYHGTESYAVWARSYRYSPVGALLTATDTTAGARVFHYDAAHRLIAAHGPRGASQRFSHDAAGNLTAAPALREASFLRNRITGANGQRFTYTERDHIASEWSDGGITRYRYDAEDRLIACETPQGSVSFAYDALGRRQAKTSAEGRTEFVWDGERLAAEIAPGGALRVYVYADGDAMSPFAFVDYAHLGADPAAGVLRHVFTDQVACPVLVEDHGGRPLWRAEIAPYGETRISPGARITLNLRWPGHYYDAETELHYNRHRYYSPVLGRYIQVDPRDIEGGFNLYGYPARPLDTVDVDGLAPCAKKAMIKDDGKDAALTAAKKEAQEVADNLRKAMQKAVDNEEMHPLNAAGVTLATMVVLRNDGTYEVVVTGNVNPANMPKRVREQIPEGARIVGHGDDRPKPVGQNDDDWRFPRTKPNGEEDPTTHKHAEQRGLRAVDCDDDAKGVAFIAPTRPCCEGCSKAIQTPWKQKGEKGGGWGGDNDNVSAHGQQPGRHGDFW
ncbi:RHS repeat-associated core domain-containing protein [Plastoroseomonas arctica]|uniref:RHS repeat protein n=1 Tax=Plastoroseomonas arctica TaxID=1509237 RepID=A0AAF1KLD8_9PROT|nr:RHS repeat-associated core domain-containing protein [Plastoroseomonas arctica]MBR0655529.1 RHS repeat protein [Plastoroseomonas arctica]